MEQATAISGDQARKQVRTNYQQTIAALQVSDALLKLCVVVEATGLSAPTIYRRMRADDFPRPIRLGPRSPRWRAGDVSAWLKEKGAR